MLDRGVAVIGLGYIGLPTSAVLAGHGVTVKGVDVNPSTVGAVNEGRIHIVEPDLDVAVARAHELGLLTASTEVPEADAYLIAVPTPFHDDKLPDLRYVQAAAESIAPRLRGGEVVVLESTSPPGTTRRISEWIGALRPDLRMPHEHPDSPDVHVAHCPERVLPGRIMTEIISNDRVVGGLTPRCTEAAAAIYATFCQGEILFTDAESAEMSKLVENSFRDVNIAFANELAEVCHHVGLDVWEVIRLANRHPRVNVLQPGPGVGGHCIAVDPWFIVAAAPQQARLIRAAREINDARPASVVRQVQQLTASDATIAALGLSFKANIDDLRESPAVEVVRLLAESMPRASILAVEPHVETLPANLAELPHVALETLETAVAKASTIVLLVDHDAFADLTLRQLEGRSIVDTRGQLTVTRP